MKTSDFVLDIYDRVDDARAKMSDASAIEMIDDIIRNLKMLRNDIESPAVGNKIIVVHAQ